MKLKRMPAAFCLIFLVFCLVSAPVQPVSAKRVALVIGIDDYTHPTLPNLNNAVRDARGIARKLESLGFKTILKTDSGKRALWRALEQFEIELAGADAGLIYYAGHGIAARGSNWLIPSDARIDAEIDLRAEAIPASELLRTMKRTDTALKIVVLDACRDNPLPVRTRSLSRGLVMESTTASGTAMLYSAGKGQVAADGTVGGHGLFTGALLDALDRPGATLEQVFRATAKTVNRLSRGSQTPWFHSSVTQDFYFRARPDPAPAVQTAAPVRQVAPVQSVPAPGDPRIELEFWTHVKASDDPADFEAYLETFPNGKFAFLVRKRLARLRATGGPKKIQPGLKREPEAPLPETTKKAAPSVPQKSSVKTAGAAAPNPAPVKPPVLQVINLQADMWVAGQGTVNVRLGPSTSTRRIARLGAGSKVRVIGQVMGQNWYRILTPENGPGFIYGPLLQATSTQKAPPPEPEPVLLPGDEFQDCERCPKMVVMPSGSFTMGDLNGVGHNNEKPAHLVRFDYRFAVGKFEVTQMEWQHLMGVLPGAEDNLQRPVSGISWFDAQAYVEKLNALTKQTYRLLTEAEWEYVARAGTSTRYSWGNGSAICQRGSIQGARFNDPEGCTFAGAVQVGSYRANGWNVHDMHGNLREWVQDCWQSDYRLSPVNGSPHLSPNCQFAVLRGGSWASDAADLRSARRLLGQMNKGHDVNGFRVARTLSNANVQ